MCKHVAAVLYGIGSRLDQKPELLFHLRAVDENDLVAHIDTGLSLAKKGADAGKVLETDDLSALFGLDMAEGFAAGADLPAPQPARKEKKRRTRGKSGTGRKAVAPPAQKKSAAKAKTTKSRKRRPDASTPQENAAWREVEELISRRNGPAYERATDLLLDLREGSRKGRMATRFARLLATLRARHERKGRLMERLDAADLS
jgi:uncharacterized Zn finger protein